VSVSEAIDRWVNKNAAKISLYWRGCLAGLISLSCPLCGKPLKRVRMGRFICRDPKCRLIEVRLYKGLVEVRIEPLQTITFRLGFRGYAWEEEA